VRILRVTRYSSPESRATTIVREHDITVSIEEAIKQLTAPSVGFIVSEVFEMAGAPSIEEAAFEAEKRRRLGAFDEDNQAICYYWSVMQLRLLKGDGLLGMKDPSPLSVAQLEVVLRQIAQHANYQRQTIVAIASDARIVKMRGGEILCEMTGS